MSKPVYTTAELHSQNPQPTYTDEAQQAKFVLGGIGTGNISVGTRGQLTDWEIINRPGKGNELPYTFFALWTKDDNGQPIGKVLESKRKQPFERSHGYFSPEMAGLPRFKSAKLKGEYPFVNISLEDDSLPLKVDMEAFTPFIPLNADDSGIPGVVIRYRVKNLSATDKPVSIAGSLANAVSCSSHAIFGGIHVKEHGQNEFFNKDGIQGLYYTAPNLPKEDLSHGSMAIMTAAKDVTHKVQWLNTGWWDGAHEFWDDFMEDGRLHEAVQPGKRGHFNQHWAKEKTGSLAIHETIPAGGEKVFEFIISWHFPNRPKGWTEHDAKEVAKAACGPDCDCGDTIPIVTNYYTTLWPNAWEAGKYLQSNLPQLEEHSRNFHRALFTSTLPDYVIDALQANIVVIRSTTCYRLSDGTFMGWEGCFSHSGCCTGNCSHVWNYTQTMAFLFPELEQSMRQTEFLIETNDEGSMAFRAVQIYGMPRHDAIPATDGQLGAIIRLYRDWKFSGNDELLKQVWEKASLALDFAFWYWDTDGDFVLDSQQHNTYDIEFHGPNTLSNSMFYGALKAGIEMAEHLGDTAHAQKYREALDKGPAKMDELLWGGEYYIQAIDDVDEYQYQYGKGCLSDQLLGQQLAHVSGLGHILPAEHVKKAVHSIFKYNFMSDFSDHHNVQRTYAINDEKGLLLCSWPTGGRPRFPFVYSDEVWTGIEYQVASHLIYEGWIDEGLTIVKALRERFNGHNRNPWNEIECGNHYARSMASWALLTALSGYRFDMVNGAISFDPVISQDDFSCFFSTGKAWGIYKQTKDASGKLTFETEVLYGDLDGVKVN